MNFFETDRAILDRFESMNIVEVFFVPTVRFVALSCLLLWAAQVQADLNCASGQTKTTFSFGANSWPAGSLGPNTYTAGSGAGAVSFSVTISGTGLVINGDDGTWPANATMGNMPNSLEVDANQSNKTDFVRIAFSFSQSLPQLEYVVADVDRGTYQDQLKFSDSPTLTRVTLGNYVDYSSGDIIYAKRNPDTTFDCNSTNANCNIGVNYNTSLTSATLDYGNGPNADNNPGLQAIAINNFQFCVPAKPNPDLALVKSDSNTTFAAGNTGTYTFTVQNHGGAATTGTTTVKDILPAGMSFNSSLTPGGTNGANWSCTVSTTANANDTATCTSTIAIAAASGSTPGQSVFTLPVNVASYAEPSLDNRAKVYGGGDPYKTTETWTGMIAACTATSEGSMGNIANAGCGFETTPISNSNTLDYGDAPTSYDPTGGGQSAARHTATGARLGATRDVEASKATPLNGTGDDSTGIDDEDALVVFPQIRASTSLQTFQLNVAVSNIPTNGAKLCGWIDRNSSGGFTNFNPNERACTTVTSGATTATLSWAIPSITAGSTYARLRIINDSGSDNFNPTGLQDNGEVEDYPVTVVSVASIDAVDDSFAVTPTASGGTTASVVLNDTTTNGGSVILGTGGNATLTPGTAPAPAAGSISMDPNTGIITVAAGTTPGTYDYPYTICTVPPTTPTATCDTATATITVNATVPITLASVVSRQNPSGLAVEWTTATETRNVGFQLYGRMAGEPDWQPLTANLIPSNVVDSLEPQRYTATFPGIVVDELLIEDWDTQGQTERHGPFAVGRKHGFDAVAAAKPINWAAIHAENEQTQRQTQAAKRTIKVAGAPDALLWVTQPGVQRVTFGELQAAGASFSGVAIADLALTDEGKQHPRYVNDANNNGQFDNGDTVEFLGQVTPTLYSARNAYRLQADRSRVREANSKSLDPKNATSGVFDHTIQVEQQLVYSFAAPGGDPWYDQRLLAYTSPVSLTRTFDLPGYAGGDARLTLRHWGVTDWPGDAPDHHLIVKVNDQQVDEAQFDGSVDATRTLVLPQGLAQAMGNRLTLEAPGDTGYKYDIQALDGFTVQYGRHTEADNGAWQGELTADAKVLITGFQGESVAWRDAQRRIGAEQLIVNGQGIWFAADSRAIRRPTIQVDLPTPAAAPKAKEVDYLIISHPLFSDSPAMSDLVALQEDRGYRTAVIDVDTLYAAYSDFEVSADAISRYLKQAKPRFVLLVGGDSYDYHNYLGLASQSFIPTRYAQTVAPVTYAPADGWYVDYNNDGKPQAALGRLPARTVAELTQLVAKVVNFAPPTHAVFGAGPSDGGSRQFVLINEGYAAQLPTNWTRQLVTVDDLGLAPAKTALQTELNRGGALVSYMGHSSYAMWGLSASGILLSASEARGLSNATPLLVAQWGCWNTYFVNPKQDTMANAFLFQARGAAAVLGATALSDVSVLTGLGKVFFKQLGQSATLGEALQAAQRTYLNQNPAATGKLRGFALLGDPAAPVR